MPAGALLCPFLIAAAARAGDKAPLLLLAILGGLLWAVFALTPMEEAGGKKGGGRIDWSFLRSARFWLLVGLIFCQNAAETSVTGWMVTYFKDSGIIAGALSTYTVTVMWGATLIARMLIAFVFPFQNPRRAMVGMGAGCIVTYLGLMLARSQTPAILLLFLFAFAMAGMNPTAVAAAGRMTTVTSHCHPAAGGQSGRHRHALDHRGGGPSTRASPRAWPPTSCPVWGCWCLRCWWPACPREEDA